ncbi:MAG: M1 family metallopeptidase [Phycisphaerae bacterium]|nr:M1 family metallopeptidase [Phycisphaerae bacterium]
MLALAAFSLLVTSAAFAHPPYIDDPRLLDDGPWIHVDKQKRTDSFRQLDEILPTPNEQRTASGAPGPKYWQQKASHVIKATLDAEKHTIVGWERIRYENHSPDELRYLWLQLDQNRFRRESLGDRSVAAPDMAAGQSVKWLRGIVLQHAWGDPTSGETASGMKSGYDIRSVKSADGAPLAHTIVDTMMRIDLPVALKPGASIEFEIDYAFPIISNEVWGGRSCYELLPESKLPIYDMAQWFPRMAPYTDENGWQHKQFLGSSEFALEFGDYDVEIDVPDTFVVAATGELLNGNEVLTTAQRERFAAARSAEKPTFVITPDEAKANESKTASGRKTWKFHATNVRDFAWAASPTFVWDAWGVKVPGSTNVAMAMSFYPSLAASLWSVYSTQAVAHTIESYSRHAYPYPYPVAISVNGPVGGMEYPMISFNGPRPEKDGTWSKGAKYGLVSVVIHEVGHNWFPMIINSDERQWTWMDEGLNTFCQYLAEQEWEEKYPSGRGEPFKLIDHMKSRAQTPVMTNSESVLQFGPSQYAKPATALNVLRESVLGRDLFDFAFREYCRRWAFHRPEPADFFRTMEDASGMDLDWFWRGWFYSTDHVDVDVERVVTWSPKGLDVEADKAREKAKREEDRGATLAAERNKPLDKRVGRFPELKDFYTSFDELDVTAEDRRSCERFLNDLEPVERDATKTTLHFTVARFRNLGGLVTFLPLEITFEDGSKDFVRLPAEIWKQNSVVTSKLFVTAKAIASIELDPRRETADIDRSNNRFPQSIAAETFALTNASKERNPMQRARDEECRDQCEKIANSLAPVFLETWKNIPDDRWPTPLEIAGDLTKRARDKGLLEAPAGSVITLEFSDEKARPGQDPKALRLATVVLSVAGSPDKPSEKGSEKPKPVRFVIWFDGSVRPDESTH